MRYLSYLVLTMVIASCGTTTNVTEVIDPPATSIKYATTALTKTYSNGYSGDMSEVKCLGDMTQAYEEWDEDANSSLLRKINLTVLPVTNQVPDKQTNLPLDMTLMTQNLSSNLGLGYHVVFTPGLSDIAKAPNSIYTNKYQTFLAERFGDIRQKDDSSDMFSASNKNIALIAAVTQYEDALLQKLSAVDIQANGTTSNKAIDVGFNEKKDRYKTRITMTFNIAYDAIVGNFLTPQLILHPFAATTVSINLEDSFVDDEFSFSFDGAKPAIGYKSRLATTDSRHAAIKLLLERGITIAIGKYLRAPYWRCFRENTNATFSSSPNNAHSTRTNKNESTPAGMRPEELTEAKKLYGFDEEVELSVRRLYNFRGSPMGLPPFIVRPLKNPKANEFWIEVGYESANGDIDRTKKSSHYIFPAEQINKYITEKKKCEKDFREELRKIDKEEKKRELIIVDKEKVVKECRSKAIEELRSKFTLLNNPETRMIGGVSITTTKEAMFIDLKRLYEKGVSLLERNSDLIASDYQEYLIEVNKQRGPLFDSKESDEKLEDAFVGLWMNLPFRKNGRLNPYHIYSEQ